MSILEQLRDVVNCNRRVIGLAAGLLVGVGQIVRAQAGLGPSDVVVHGDTTSMRALCSPSLAVNAIRGWFDAVSTGDTSKIAQNIAQHFEWVTVQRFVSTEPFFDGRTWADLPRYVATRTAHHERLRLREVTFNTPRSGMLQFGPIFFDRAADDIPPSDSRGVGKGAYRCGDGIVALSVAPLR